MYVNSISTTLGLGWLLILKLRDYSLLKAIFKALYTDNWPSYLNLHIVKPLRHLRNVTPRLLVPPVQGTSQHSSAMVFNDLPVKIRNCLDFREYCRLCKKFWKCMLCLPCKTFPCVHLLYMHKMYRSYSNLVVL